MLETLNAEWGTTNDVYSLLFIYLMLFFFISNTYRWKVIRTAQTVIKKKNWKRIVQKLRDGHVCMRVDGRVLITIIVSTIMEYYFYYFFFLFRVQVDREVPRIHVYRRRTPLLPTDIRIPYVGPLGARVCASPPRHHGVRARATRTVRACVRACRGGTAANMAHMMILGTTGRAHTRFISPQT